MKKKNTVVRIILIILVVFLGFLSIKTFIVDSNQNKGKTELSASLKNEIKYVRIKYLVTEKSNDSYSINDVFPSHFDDYLAFASEYMLLVKDGDYSLAKKIEKDGYNEYIVTDSIQEENVHE